MTDSSAAHTCRIPALDRIRTLAMLCVVLIHTASPLLMQAAPGSSAYLWASFYSSLARGAVPLFLMLSGALLLDETRDFSRKKMVHKVGNLLALLYGSSLFYAVGSQLLPSLLGNAPFSPARFLERLLMGHYHLWYLYVLCGLYLITPVLKLFVNRSHYSAVAWLAGLGLVFEFFNPLGNLLSEQLLHIPQGVQKFLQLFHVGLINQYLTYYLLGWLLITRPPEKKSRLFLYLAGFLCLGITFLGLVFWGGRLPNAPDVFCNSGSFHILIYSAGIFVFLLNTSSAADFCSSRIAGLSLGVYLIHPVFVDIFSTHLFFPLYACLIPLRWLLACAISLLVCAGISAIPGFKKCIMLR